MAIHYTPLVVAFTPSYFIPAVTCLYSVLSHSAETEHYEVICLMSEPLPNEQRAMLEELSPSGRLQFRFLELEGRLKDIAVNPRFSVASLYRMLLPELLPSYDMVIYHDCDMIIRQDLGALYRRVELGDHLLGVVVEPTLPHQEEMLQRVGVPRGQYFNSGFLLMNLKQMRQEGTSQKLIEVTKSLDTDFLDQDALNIVCLNRTLKLPPRYNSIRTMLLPQYKTDFLSMYSEGEWLQVQRAGNVHYTGHKPWNHYTIMMPLWWHHYLELPERIRQSMPYNEHAYRLFRLEDHPVMGRLLSLLRWIKRKMKR